MPAWFGGELRGKGPLYLYGYLAAQLTQYCLVARRGDLGTAAVGCPAGPLGLSRSWAAYAVIERRPIGGLLSGESPT
jgi:hypothetical protein